ncbi:hypothetical protein TNCV_2196101 [Trichonephila clavipes]|nr:hypothetical protein TNCV_2196101 [Trichonephila clavipes]
MWQRGLIGRTAHARVPSQRESAFISRREQLESVSSTRERSVDICSRLLPLDERLYLAPSASLEREMKCGKRMDMVDTWSPAEDSNLKVWDLLSLCLSV